ncbi:MULTISPECIES: LysM peptidoglycan-binding domain-containing protein [unclassified Acinetobacter]|uniref:LysM peptidoglycan-binding domain-containing protein n=1 Tax=unclassified Acinetobacter TaxID=196816 RepID=UPI002934E886|nr:MULTISPECIES: LysM peptidoglycan-binding domain-containing protein [unclassified Acinetobacter]WOE31783.1 LysM peptidoglycan-binding domain-containing protein [Acinetobacter sp. SAAs470]WOE37250.1 LysM peptidoglycan-binding domain-containing protein [Acinetobacter sp. SAAs474]
MYKSTTTMWQPKLPSLFKITVLGSALLAMGVITGCSSTPSASKTTKSKQLNSGSGYLDADSLNSLEDLLSATDMRAVEGDRLLILKHGDVWKRMRVGFKLDTDQWNPRIDAQRSWFVSRQPYIDRLSARASRYLYHTVKEAERRGLPTELALLPVIESSYDPAATSSAAAAGLWQFIPSTGKIYGLRQTSLYDGRRDVVESTRAAYEFLGSLYNQFGSWELALAAYNAGPGRIQQAINRNQAAGLPTDFWSLKLPQETMNYVPRFLAVAQIIKNPQSYGVSLPPIANRPHFREVTVGAVDLNDVALVTGLSRAEIYALNPGHRGENIDFNSPMKLLIPADLSPTVDGKLKKLSGSNAALLAADRPVSKAPVASVTTTVSAAKPTVSSTPAMVANTTVANNSNMTAAVRKGATPKGSDALAAFASNSDIPSAPRIPVAVTPASNVKPVTVEPPISETEKAQILAAVKAEGASKTVDEVLKPIASKAEQDLVVEELKLIAPQGTEIVDPYDGKIKLTAIQTSQSVAEQQGKEVTKGFAYPKSVAANTKADSAEARLNQGKNVIQTESEVVVIAPKGKRSTYTVIAGDTLALIAAKNGVSWRDIAKWNQIDPNGTLFAGTTIYLYDAKPVVESSSKEKAKPETYLVQANDSLTNVAARFGLSVKQLADYNNLAPNSNLLIGQKLNLQETEAVKSKNDVIQKTEAKSKVATKSYVVKRGEYLKLIAERYGLSTQELADLTPDLNSTSSLMAGQKINVPLNEVSDTKSNTKNTLNESNSKVEVNRKVESYTVQRGDTLYSVANATNISIAELASLNNLSTSQGLLAGQVIKVPVTQPSTEHKRLPDSYTVQSGDTLSAIANKYNLAIDDLLEFNDLSLNSSIQVGQKLKLLGDVKKTSKSSKQNDSSAESKTKVTTVKETEKYVVKSGESLNVIASRTGSSVAELAALNNLSTRAGLRVGQTLLIPKTVTEYKVKRGDTLIGLANRYGIDSAALAELNGIKANTQLKIGDVIKVPN